MFKLIYLICKEFSRINEDNQPSNRKCIKNMCKQFTEEIQIASVSEKNIILHY